MIDVAIILTIATSETNYPMARLILFDIFRFLNHFQMIKSAVSLTLAPTWQTVMPAMGVPVKMEGAEKKRKRMVRMLLLSPRWRRRRLLGFHVCWLVGQGR